MVMRARPRSYSWRFRRLFPGSSESARFRPRPIRSRNSAAAARVKVTHSIREISAVEFSSVRSRVMRSVRVAVFPDPAAAERRSASPL